MLFDGGDALKRLMGLFAQADEVLDFLREVIEVARIARKSRSTFGTCPPGRQYRL